MIDLLGVLLLIIEPVQEIPDLLVLDVLGASQASELFSAHLVVSRYQLFQFAQYRVHLGLQILASVLGRGGGSGPHIEVLQSTRSGVVVTIHQGVQRGGMLDPPK